MLQSSSMKQNYIQWYNGSQYKFLDPLDENLFCKQCKQLAYEPHHCCYCFSLFCKKCTFLSTCPACNTRNDNVFDKESNALIRNLVVRCPNSVQIGSGCGWKGELREVLHHQITCQWVPCPYSVVGCENKMYRSMTEKHEKNYCEFHLSLAMKKVVSLTAAVKKMQERVKQLDELQENVESGLRGVDSCGEMSLTLTDKAQKFIWKKFGLNLTIPSGVLQPGVDQCELLIKASLSGHYQLPESYHLVSPIFWIHCEPHCKFAKAISLEIQHCALNQNVSKLSFVKALCTQKELPYSFEVIPGGKFSESNSYGLIELNRFSGYGAAQKGSKEREYCASLFYLTNSIYGRQVDFTVTWNTNAHRNETEKEYSCLKATPGLDQEIEFEADAITLNFPEGGERKERSWELVPLMAPKVTKMQVDSFGSGKRIPHCSLKVHKLSDTQATEMHRVNLHGARDNSFFVICLGPAADVMSESQVSQRLREEDVGHLKDRLKDYASKWRTIGCYLQFSQGQMDNIQSNLSLISNGPVSYFCELLTQWIREGDATKEHLKSALRKSGLGAAATEIH